MVDVRSFALEILSPVSCPILDLQIAFSQYITVEWQSHPVIPRSKKESSRRLLARCLVCALQQPKTTILPMIRSVGLTKIRDWDPECVVRLTSD